MKDTKSAPSPNRGPTRTQIATHPSSSQSRPPRPELVGLVAFRLLEDGGIEFHAWGRRPFRVARRRLDAVGRYLADHKAGDPAGDRGGQNAGWLA
jgi:hypothetical protein